MGGSCERAAQGAQFDAICALIEGARTIAICAHTSPDGDALGSGLALAEIIERTWPGREVTSLLADDDVVPRIYEFLPGVDRLVRAGKLIPGQLVALVGFGAGLDTGACLLRWE